MKYKDVKENNEIKCYLEKGDQNLESLGYTDHSAAHACLVADRAGEILEKLEVRCYNFTQILHNPFPYFTK